MSIKDENKMDKQCKTYHKAMFASLLQVVRDVVQDLLVQ